MRQGLRLVCWCLRGRRKWGPGLRLGSVGLSWGWVDTRCSFLRGSEAVSLPPLPSAHSAVSTQLLPQLPCPARCAPPPTPPHHHYTTLAPLSLASPLPPPPTHQPFLPDSLPMEVRGRKVGRKDASCSASRWGVWCCDGRVASGRLGRGGVGTRPLSQPPRERCFAIPGRWGQCFLLPEPRGWQPLTFFYPGSPRLNLNLLFLTPDLAMVSARPPGVTHSVSFMGASMPINFYQPGALGGGFALERS